MKFTKFSLMLLVVLLVASMSAYSAIAVVYVKVNDKSGSRTWDEIKECCPKKGLNCIKNRQEVPDVGTLTSLGSDYFRIDAHVEDALLEIETPVGGSFTRNESNSNYTFDEFEELEITTCADFPHLEGTTISLNGITTDANGNFQVLIYAPLP